MEADKDALEISPKNVSIYLPDGTLWDADEGGDIAEFIDKAMEFLKSPEFLSTIMPALSEHAVRTHEQIMERLDLERQKVAQAGKYELQFLIGRLIMGGALIAAVTWLTLVGKLATETTIVTLMATLGFIMWGKGQN